MIAIMQARQAFGAVSLGFIRHMQPSAIALIRLWIFQNKLVKIEIVGYPMRQLNIVHTHHLKINGLAATMAA